MPKRSPGASASPSLREADDAAGDEARRSARRRAGPCGAVDDDAVPLIVLARLVEVGVEELSRLVGDPRHPSRYRRAVHVAIEDVHEHRDAAARPLAEAELGRRHAKHHRRDAAVGGADHEVRLDRHDARRIAEEIRRHQPATMAAIQNSGCQRNRPATATRRAARMNGAPSLRMGTRLARME